MNKFLLCATALILISATSAADAAYARRTIGGGTVVRGAGVYSGRYHGNYHRGYGYPAAVGVGAAAVGAATGWGYQPYGYGYGQGYGQRCSCY